MRRFTKVACAGFPGCARVQSVLLHTKATVRWLLVRRTGLPVRTKAPQRTELAQPASQPAVGVWAGKRLYVLAGGLVATPTWLWLL